MLAYRITKSLPRAQTEQLLYLRSARSEVVCWEYWLHYRHTDRWFHLILLEAWIVL